MLLFRFYLGTEPYAISSDEITEILPLVTLKTIPHAPAYLTGIFNYRGILTPVLDLRQLIFSQPCEAYLSTRILIFHYQHHPVGLLAEQVTDTLNEQQIQWHDLTLQIKSSPYLGPLLTDASGTMIQSLRLSALISEDIADSLFNLAV